VNTDYGLNINIPYPSSVSESAFMLMKNQSGKFQEYADRIEALPNGDTHTVWSKVRQILYSSDNVSMVHSNLRKYIEQLEHDHWVMCAQWLLAERDLRVNQDVAYVTVKADVSGFADDLRKIADTMTSGHNQYG
jgi:hypothetical protein